jgi:hypothetical protein
MTSGAQHLNADFGSTVLAVLYGGIHARWNILSVPLVPSSGDLRKVALFPSAISPAYAYEDQYVLKDTLEPGRGYWLKFDSAQTVGMTGLGRTLDTVAVSKGWNLVGSLTDEFPSAAVGSQPPGIIESPFYGYSNGYSAADTLEPFHAYWVKVSQNGLLFMSSAAGPLRSVAKSAIGSRREGAGAEESLDGLSQLEIVDARGNRQILHVAARDSGAAPLGFELPPLPPSGIFDARFASDRTVESHPRAVEEPIAFGIRVQAEAFPVTVRWTLAQGAPFRYRLSRESKGKPAAAWNLGAGASMEIGSSGILQLTLTVEPAAAIPKEYALAQNYPNPFNPSTEIGYSLPSQSYVKLTVYNILGEVVETLIDGIEDAGVHQKRWSPGVASGVYFYRIDARSVTDPGSSFSTVKKMMLVR